MNYSLKQICFALFAVVACCNTNGVQAQEIGLRATGGMSYERIAGRYGEGNRRGTFISGNVYYEQRLTNRLAISAGLGLTQIPDAPNRYFYFEPYYSRERVRLVETPVNLYVKLLPASSKPWSLRMLATYTFAREIEVQSLIWDGFQPENEPEVSRSYTDLHSYHYLGFGLEGKFRFRNRQTITIGLVQCWQASYTYHALAPETSRRQVDCCLMVATGFDFRRPVNAGRQ